MEEYMDRYRVVPKRFANAKITREQTPEWHPEVYSVCREYLEGFDTYWEQGTAPYFSGMSNTGKTYAAAAIFNYLANRAVERVWEWKPLWAPVGEYLHATTVAHDFRRSQFYTMDAAVKNATLVVFDDFAHLQDYPRYRELFWVYVNHRYDAQLSTIFTANLDMEQGWKALENAFGIHFRKRIEEMSKGLAVSVA